jgi:hypothetical protein
MRSKGEVNQVKESSTSQHKVVVTMHPVPSAGEIINVFPLRVKSSLNLVGQNTYVIFIENECASLVPWSTGIYIRYGTLYQAPISIFFGPL